jgi:transposase-like protein
VSRSTGLTWKRANSTVVSGATSASYVEIKFWNRRSKEVTVQRWEHTHVHRAVATGSSVYTDALSSYRKLDNEYIHNVIDHAEKYVEGEVHTNGLENFWSLLKRTINGTYVSIEPFHLFRYLNEQAFRFNYRDMTDNQRFSEVAGSVFGKRLTYSELTGKGAVV